MNMQKQIVGTNFVWKIAFKHTVEDYKWTQRNAGYNCRKKLVK
jgi:hypothetical protein